MPLTLGLIARPSDFLLTRDDPQEVMAMRSIFHLTLALSLMVALTGCGGDSKDSADRAAEAQKAMQQGLQKEQKMMEGMVKGVEAVEKKAAETKDESKK
jgi:hypothetical protein